jgi:hypothetical protein
MEDRIGHNEFLDGQRLNEFFECLIFAKAVKAVHVDLPRTHLLQLFDVQLRGHSRSDEVVEQQNVPSFDVLSNVANVVEEADFALKAEYFEAVF